MSNVFNSNSNIHPIGIEKGELPTCLHIFLCSTQSTSLFHYIITIASLYNINFNTFNLLLWQRLVNSDFSFYGIPMHVFPHFYHFFKISVCCQLYPLSVQYFQYHTNIHFQYFQYHTNIHFQYFQYHTNIHFLVIDSKTWFPIFIERFHSLFPSINFLVFYTIAVIPVSVLLTALQLYG